MTLSQPVEWSRHPEAERFMAELLDRFLVAHSQAQELNTQLLLRTSSRFADWLDHLILRDGDVPRQQLADLGFEQDAIAAPAGDSVFYHPGAVLPRLLLREDAPGESGNVVAAAIKVEDITEFLMTLRLHAPIDGAPFSPYRRALAGRAGHLDLWAIERRGYNGFVPIDLSPATIDRQHYAYERWATRERIYAESQKGMEQTLSLARSLVSELGTDLAAWTVFKAERAYWQRRNWAGQTQRGRQDRMGLGWANHDHHTFRSSRDVFPLLIEILETLGFRSRERFYAGAEAGWGAQVMEQSTCSLVVFADVDLSPTEALGDFAHEGLAPRQELGTVGLWCSLHGESMLEAGLHHLAAQLSFDAATADLHRVGVEMMQPFSQFSYLKQAFTQGERWRVPNQRLSYLQTIKQITANQRERFTRDGVLGSHLENIQRGEGFKGFNQQTVSDIIRRTDPRSG